MDSFEPFIINNDEDIDSNVSFINFGHVKFPHKINTKKVCCCCLGEDDNLESYILPCGHTAHTRCFRKYMSVSSKCECTICRNMELNTCCKICQKEGYYICSEKCLDVFKKKHNI